MLAKLVLSFSIIVFNMMKLLVILFIMKLIAQINIFKNKALFFKEISSSLKVVSATFLQVYFACLKESTCGTRKSFFNFTSKALFVLEIIKF